MTEPLEIERKFLIEMPDRALLDRCPVRWEMWQTYLLSRPGVSARVRRRVGETEQFFHTEKQRLTDRTCVEREREIDAREYEALLAQRDPARVTIHKMRYCLPEGGLVFEIDVYPFWRQLAVMEVELQREEQSFTVPRGLLVLREVSGDRRLKNAALAGHVPPEEELLAEAAGNGITPLHGSLECGKIIWEYRRGNNCRCIFAEIVLRHGFDIYTHT